MGSWVVLDAMGVIYSQARISGLLSTFAARHGVTVDPAAARAIYLRASLGEMTSARLWETLGITGAGLDEEFVSGRDLMAGVHGFLDQMRDCGVSVACITNDVAEWSRLSRAAHGLEEWIPLWVVSGEVGIRKPGTGIYERFLDLAGSTAAECLFVDDQVENLDAAQRMGFATAWFTSNGSQGAHQCLGSFDAVLSLIEQPYRRMAVPTTGRQSDGER